MYRHRVLIPGWRKVLFSFSLSDRASRFRVNSRLSAWNWAQKLIRVFDQNDFLLGQTEVPVYQRFQLFLQRIDLFFSFFLPFFADINIIERRRSSCIRFQIAKQILQPGVKLPELVGYFFDDLTSFR